MTIKLAPEKKQSEAVRPAKRWRNKYWAPEPTFDRVLGDVPAGEFWGNSIHPSREVAEAYAMKNWPLNVELCPGAKYLGAFPVTEGQ